MRGLIVSAHLALALTIAICSPAAARHRHHVVHHHRVDAPAFHSNPVHCDDRFLWTCDVRGPQSGMHHAPSARHAAVPHSAGRVCAERGCAAVVAWATGQFQGLIDAFRELGYVVGSPGCLSSDHMHNSKHHWGGACDLFNQVARNRTALRQPPPHVQIEVARSHGLVSGCVWHRPDCGHFEVAQRR